MSDAAYSWVKDVQVDGTTSGMPIRLAGTYRCVVRDSHVHNSYSYGFAQDNYGIVLACGAADNLVENNVARFMNKPILFNNSGRRQRRRLQLRGQLVVVRRQQRRRLPGSEHRLPLRLPAHGAHRRQLGAAHGRIDHARQRRVPHLLPQLCLEPVVAEQSGHDGLGDHLEPALRPAVRQRRVAAVRHAGPEDDRHRQRAGQHGDSSLGLPADLGTTAPSAERPARHLAESTRRRAAAASPSSWSTRRASRGRAPGSTATSTP